MNKQTKAKLHAIWEECDDDDKSTEYMIARMMDGTGLSYDEVIDFMVSHGEEQHQWAG